MASSQFVLSVYWFFVTASNTLSENYDCLFFVGNLLKSKILFVFLWSSNLFGSNVILPVTHSNMNGAFDLILLTMSELREIERVIYGNQFHLFDWQSTHHSWNSLEIKYDTPHHYGFAAICSLTLSWAKKWTWQIRCIGALTTKSDSKNNKQTAWTWVWGLVGSDVSQEIVLNCRKRQTHVLTAT